MTWKMDRRARLTALMMCGLMGMASTAQAQTLRHEVRALTCQPAQGGVTVYINGGAKSPSGPKQHKLKEIKQLSGGWSGEVVEVGAYTSKVLVSGGRCNGQNLARRFAPTPPNPPKPEPKPEPEPTKKAPSFAERCEAMRVEQVQLNWWTAKQGSAAAKACDGDPTRRELNLVEDGVIKHRCGMVTCAKDPSKRANTH